MRLYGHTDGSDGNDDWRTAGSHLDGAWDAVYDHWRTHYGGTGSDTCTPWVFIIYLFSPTLNSNTRREITYSSSDGLPAWLPTRFPIYHVTG